jgi:hypothetical protein
VKWLSGQGSWDDKLNPKKNQGNDEGLCSIFLSVILYKNQWYFFIEI